MVKETKSARKESEMAKAKKEMLEKTVEIISRPIPWAPGLPIGADGWVGKFFKKD